MKETTRLKLKIVSSFLMCVLSLFSIVSLTLSWFAFNDKASGDNMAVVGSANDLVENCEYYRVKKAAGGYGMQKLPTNETPSLNVYDVLSGEYQLVVKITLKEGVGAVKLGGNTTTDYFLGDGKHPLRSAKSVTELHVPKEGTYTDESGVSHTYTNVLSSIVGICVLTETESAAALDNKLEKLPLDSRLSTFIERTENTISKDIVVAEFSDTTREIYVWITYDALLVNTVFSANIGSEDMYLKDETTNAVLTGADGLPYPIPFKWDFSLVVESA